MNAGDAVPRSTLDKPLEELTEEDITQLTREDCRRYLKEKGMRRPSWNKSQAIQQVLSLKTLLEYKPDSGDVYQKLPKIGPLKETSTTVVEEKQLRPPDLKESSFPAMNEAKRSIDGSNLVLAGNIEFRRREAGKKQFFRDDRSSSILPSSTATGNEPVGQLTIFYSGSINVYNDIPADKARSIMLLAGNPDFQPYIPVDGALTNRPFPSSSPIGWARPGSPSPPSVAITPALQTEVPKTRKASVQRFLEKRKDRLKVTMHGQKRGTSSCMEVYLNHQVRGSQIDQTRNEECTASGTSSPNGPRPPLTPS